MKCCNSFTKMKVESVLIANFPAFAWPTSTLKHVSGHQRPCYSEFSIFENFMKIQFSSVKYHDFDARTSYLMMGMLHEFNFQDKILQAHSTMWKWTKKCRARHRKWNHNTKLWIPSDSSLKIMSNPTRPIPNRGTEPEKSTTKALNDQSRRDPWIT